MAKRKKDIHGIFLWKYYAINFKHAKGNNGKENGSGIPTHRQRSLAGYSPWGLKELDMTEQLKKKTTNKEVEDLLPSLVVEASVQFSGTSLTEPYPEDPRPPE